MFLNCTAVLCPRFAFRDCEPRSVRASRFFPSAFALGLAADRGVCIEQRFTPRPPFFQVQPRSTAYQTSTLWCVPASSALRCPSWVLLRDVIRILIPTTIPTSILYAAIGRVLTNCAHVAARMAPQSGFTRNRTRPPPRIGKYICSWYAARSYHISRHRLSTSLSSSPAAPLPRSLGTATADQP